MAAPRKVMAMIGALAVAGGLSAGAIALAANNDPASTPSPRVTATSNDDGTLDQGPGDAPGTAGATEDGRHEGNDDGTADQGPGDAFGDDDANEGPSSNSGPSENSGPGSVRDDDHEGEAEDHSGHDGGSEGSDDGTADQGHGDA
jgi:hypothetical protein